MFVAGDGGVYIPVVVRGVYELQAIVQSRCLRLSGMDIHIYKREATTHHDYLPRLTAQQLTVLHICRSPLAD